MTHSTFQTSHVWRKSRESLTAGPLPADLLVDISHHEAVLRLQPSGSFLFFSGQKGRLRGTAFSFVETALLVSDD